MTSPPRHSAHICGLPRQRLCSTSSRRDGVTSSKHPPRMHYHRIIEFNPCSFFRVATSLYTFAPAATLSVPQDAWCKLEVQCQRRSRCIQEFQDGLEGVETLRSEAVGRELRRLVDDMVSIACRLPDEIERIAEVKAGYRLWGCRNGPARPCRPEKEKKSHPSKPVGVRSSIFRL